MRILIVGGHSMVYHSKEFIKALKQKGHECMFIEIIDYPYILNKKPWQWFKNILTFRGIVRKFKPDIRPYA